MSQSAKSKGKQRDPPPTLFLHPSPAASHVSLPGILAPGPPAQASSNAPPQAQSTAVTAAAAISRPGSIHGVSVVSHSGGGGIRGSRHLMTADSYRSADRTDALWAEMQATLEEVELSATGGTHVFGPDHDRKLAELRAAQIALAQAWARSEADDAIETGATAGAGGTTASAVGGDDLRVPKAGAALSESSGKPGAGGEGTNRPGTSSAARPGSSGLGGAERLGAKLEEETEADILLARKRREANDRYFQRVSQGVVDVVAKLEEVAVAMRAVEQESKDIWAEGDGESAPGSVKA